MALVLFNIFMWAVLQRWYAAIADNQGAGIPGTVLQHCTRIFFMRHHTNTQNNASDCQFADNLVLMVTTREAVEACALLFVKIAHSFGLMVNLEKTKLMVTGYGVIETDTRPVILDDETVEEVSEFRHLGYILHTDSQCSRDIEAQLSSSS